MSTLFSVGQMNQLADALEAAGYTADDVTKLRCSPQLATFRGVVRGQVEFAATKHIIDLDADPFVPEGWTVEEHRKGGQFEWNPAKIALYLSPEQESGRSIKGDKLRVSLKGKPVFSAALLDYLLANPQLIPEAWKGKYIFFWGTVYRRADGGLYVRFLCWGGEQWYWLCDWLGNEWSGSNPAAVPAST